MRWRRRKLRVGGPLELLLAESGPADGHLRGHGVDVVPVRVEAFGELMRSGELDSVLIRSSRRIPVAAIERYIEQLLDNRSEEERRD